MTTDVVTQEELDGLPPIPEIITVVLDQVEGLSVNIGDTHPLLATGMLIHAALGPVIRSAVLDVLVPALDWYWGEEEDDDEGEEPIVTV